ncbi:hypothetical protein [Mesorhizobium sp.]|uniref:hypothetical protein n=1 Tax=Mesorhizobium sp. TaxID=1871066 RepID=UPI000FE81F35|nr:hypothetical protein [Mesorhizobium sp.]RWF03006.1 MAG: hypothetical protein EOS43_05925 [Mesorhizobium sp.]
MDIPMRLWAAVSAVFLLLISTALVCRVLGIKSKSWPSQTRLRVSGLLHPKMFWRLWLASEEWVDDDADHTMMVRRRNGVLEYRPKTAEEAQDDEWWRAMK